MIALALAGACLAASAAPAAARQTDPYAIFAAARTHWETARYPSQVAYTVAVTVSHDGSISAAHYHSYYDSVENRVDVNAVSDEEIANPYTPHGISVFFSPFGGHIPLSSPERTFDYLGVPVLAPNYSFGIAGSVPHSPDANSSELVAEIRREFCDPAPSRNTPPDSGLKTIATVEIVRRAYVIELSGVTQIGGHPDYDLTLRPISEPGRYRLREVWVNAQTFATDKLVSQGNFTQGGMTGITWTVEFRQINGAPYLAFETTTQSFRLTRRAYDSATITFTDVTPKRAPAMMRIADFAVNPESGVPALREP
jgi:hypothetical protein